MLEDSPKQFCNFLNDTIPKCMHCFNGSCAKVSTLRASKLNVRKSIVKFVLRPLFPGISIFFSDNHVHVRGYKVCTMDITVFQVILIHITALMRMLDSICMNTTRQHISFLHILNNELHRHVAISTHILPLGPIGKYTPHNCGEHF